MRRGVKKNFSNFSKFRVYCYFDFFLLSNLFRSFLTRGLGPNFYGNPTFAVHSIFAFIENTNG